MTEPKERNIQYEDLKKVVEAGLNLDEKQKKIVEGVLKSLDHKDQNKVFDLNIARLEGTQLNLKPESAEAIIQNVDLVAYADKHFHKQSHRDEFFAGINNDPEFLQKNYPELNAKLQKDLQDYKEHSAGYAAVVEMNGLENFDNQKDKHKDHISRAQQLLIDAGLGNVILEPMHDDVKKQGTKKKVIEVSNVRTI